MPTIVTWDPRALIYQEGQICLAGYRIGSSFTGTLCKCIGHLRGDSRTKSMLPVRDIIADMAVITHSSLPLTAQAIFGGFSISISTSSQLFHSILDVQTNRFRKAKCGQE